MTSKDIQPLVKQLENMVFSVSNDQGINNVDLRRILRFITKVTQVVNQAFQNVYPILIEISYLDSNEPNYTEIKKLRKEIDLLNSRDYYRDIELICGQLKELGNQYDDQIRPIIDNQNRSTQENFNDVFMLLEHHEGYILRIVQSITRELNNKLESNNLDEAIAVAKYHAKSMKTSLAELQKLNTSILGLSGKTGFLELTETDRLSLQEKINVSLKYVDKSINTGNISGSQIAVGHSIEQSYEINQVSKLDKTDIAHLIKELISDIRQEQLPQKIEEKAINQLNVSKDELSEENPDKSYIAKNIQKVTKTLKDTGSLIDQASSIGEKIGKIAIWVGKSLAWVGIV